MASPFFKSLESMPRILSPAQTMNPPTPKLDGRLSSGPTPVNYHLPLSSIFGLFSSLSSIVPLFYNDSSSYVGSAYGVSGQSLMQSKLAKEQAQEQQRTSSIVGFASKLLTSILGFLI